MKAQTALIRTDGAVELHTIADVDVYFAFIVNPRHAECQHSLGLYYALDNLCLLKFWMLVVHILN